MAWSRAMSDTFTLDIVAGAQAFGDSSHPSTQGAIAALECLSHLRGFSNALDMGCGSGILALQAAYQWHIPVIAADIEKQAIAATIQNAKANQLQELITAVRSDGFAHPTIAQKAPYDLVIGNILAETLTRMSADFVATTADEGLLILSGILQWQADALIALFQSQGLTLLQKIKVNDWVTILMQK